MAARRPLTSRPMDLIYFIFFVVSPASPRTRLNLTTYRHAFSYRQIHIPASLIIDFQTLYPRFLLPDFVATIPRQYFDTYGDPLIGGAMGYLGDKPELAWFKSFLVVEL